MGDSRDDRERQKVKVSADDGAEAWCRDRSGERTQVGESADGCARVISELHRHVPRWVCDSSRKGDRVTNAGVCTDGSEHVPRVHRYTAPTSECVRDECEDSQVAW